ncbi:syntaxin-7 [Chrysoperla carnea]|uniref:syntaxin-7 n=1 Tax=Chrysoperla carnea TaxID=189513 RepID=UPI001D08C2E7|nr:syntaxin-7 [Chrysoperla carnea]
MDTAGSYAFSSYHNGGGTREQDSQKLAQTIGTSVQKISQNVSSMQRMVNQLGTPQDTQELRTQLHQIQHYTQQLAKDTSGNLKDLSNLPPPANPSEQRQHKMQRERLADEFTASLNSFQNTQRMAAQKEKEQMQKTKINAGLNEPYLGGIKPKQNQLIELQDNQMQRQKQIQEEVNLQILQQQEQSIRQLESDISDVNQIFKELGALVHEQGEIVDSIESSVERTEVFVQEGVQQLRQASTYQNKLRKKKFFCALLGAIVLSIIVTFVVLELKD